MNRRKRLITRILLIVAVFFISGVASASVILDGESCTVEADERIEGDLFVFCGELRVDGHVEGNIIGAARTATISGDIAGSIYLIGGELHVRGDLQKDLHYAGVALTVEEGINFQHENGSLLSVSFSTIIEAGIEIPGSITDVGYQLIVDGDVDEHINFWGSALRINGEVSSDVTATVGDTDSGGVSSQIQTLLIPLPIELDLVDPGLVLGETAFIGGQLEYTGPTRGSFQRGQLARPAIYYPTGNQIFDPTEQSAETLQRYLRAVMREFAELSFVGLVFLVLIPRQMQSPLRYLQARPVSTFGVGMLSFILSFPLVLLMALLSVAIIAFLSLLPIDTVVIFGGVVLGLANIGAASIFYFTAIYVARVVVGLAIGRFILRLLNRYDRSMRSLLISLVIGTLLLALAGSLPIPLIGYGIKAFTAFIGLGAILMLLRAKITLFLESTPGVPRNAVRYTTQTMTQAQPMLPYLPENTRQYPPAIIEDKSSTGGVGVDNLPEGFDWWGEDET